MKKRNLIIKIFIITILLISYTYICAINAVPNNIVIFEGEMLNLKIAKAFGKGTGFAVGLILLPFIFQLILAFDKSEYVGVEA